jgi:hypothetical protein
MKRLRQPHRTVRLLACFDQCREHTRQGKAGTVQRVAEAILPVRVLEPQVHATRLEVLEVRTARHLQIPILPGRPRLEVVRLGRSKPHITGAKLDHPVVQTEQLQHPLRVSR